MRRSFRIGLWLGVLGGMAFAVLKLRQARRPSAEPLAARDLIEPSPAPGPQWPPLEEPPLDSAASPAAPLHSEPAPTEPAPQRREPATAAATAEAGANVPVAKQAAASRKQVAPKKAATRKKEASPSWVDPDGNICPKTHPVKAKLSSKIFQLPGMFAYDRTRPDRCYRDADAAAGDGFRAAKR